MRKALSLACLLFVPLAAAAIDVDVEELKSAGQKIEFINYTGPLSIFQTDLDIRGIGRNMASQVERGSTIARFLLKYTAIHAVDSAEPDKLSADIISIDKEATVDHIDNVRRIVSAYLGRLYAYPRKDADLLALFVSYYNAVYRGNISYFGGKYKTVVMKNLAAERVGISTKYYEWPGATQLVIPLTEKPERDVLGALSTGELTSKGVAEQLKGRPDKGVEERKAMTELKSREVEKGQQKVNEQAQALAAEKAKTAEQEAALQRAKAEAEKKKAEAAASVGQPDAGQKAAEAKAAEEAVKTQESQVAQAKAEQQKEQEAIASQQKVIETKKEEIAAEKKDIQTDQNAVRAQTQPETTQAQLEKKSAELAQREQAVTKREEAAQKGETDASIYAGLLYYLKIKEYLTGGHYNNEIYSINAATAKIVQKSPVANICGRKYDIFQQGVVVITYKGDHRAGHYLALLDLKTLEPKATGSDMVFWRSFVEVRDNFIYAILNRDDAYYLGKFDSDMKAVAVSRDKVDPDSFISFFADTIYINSEDKKILVLNKGDLSTTGIIEP